MREVSTTAALAPRSLGTALDTLTCRVGAGLGRKEGISVRKVNYFSPSVKKIMGGSEGNILHLGRTRVHSIGFHPRPSFVDTLHNTDFASTSRNKRGSSTVSRTQLPRALTGLYRGRKRFASTSFHRTLRLAVPATGHLLGGLHRRNIVQGVNSSHFKVCGIYW